ncbi:MAG: site-2 protease family protein [Anaerolineales bacterium]|nr:site-2 protease family protein [Anaerolineales bacterium]
MMRNGFGLGRVFGIEIRVDWSWLFILGLVTWNLAAGVFPSLHPEWGTALNWVVGLAAAVVLFASVLAHELAHSLVAIARGLPVRRITLFMFGGVSNIEREPPSPSSEFLIAIVGPITSIALGIIFSLLGGGLGLRAGQALNNPQQLLAGLGPVATLLLWLGPVNIVLGVFNLIPGFPLDGGRVLRSILWAATSNLRRATRWASWVGQGIAWLFIGGGIAMMFGVQLPFFGTGFLSGLWLAFIGWFVNQAAAQSYQLVVVEDLLEGVPVARLMRANAPTVGPGMHVSQLVDDFIMGTDERAFPVVEGDRLVGLVCLEDVRKVARAAWDTTRLDQIMTPAAELDLATPREDAAEAMSKLAARDVRQVPVVQDGRLVGMLRRRDILRWLQLHSEATR